MILLAGLGAGVGVGCWLVVRALAPRPVPLHLVAARLALDTVRLDHRPNVEILDDPS